MVRKNCEDCSAPLDRPRVRFCPACIEEHKRQDRARRYANKIRNSKRSTIERTFRVVACPDDTWPCNVILSKTDVTATLTQGYFPTGMILENLGRHLRVCGNLFSKQFLVEVH